MSIWTDLQAAIDAEAIARGYTGTLAEVGIDQPFPSKLTTLLKLQSEIAAITNSGGAETIILAVFRAVGAGTGYSIADIIIFRQTPPAAAEYYNATTGSVIATPAPADLGSVSSASNVAVTASALPTGASTSALQSSVQADAGSDASKAIAVQGVTGGKAVPVSLGAALPTGSNTIGAISNTSFGISGTLPAFAAAPTVNIGTAPNLTITNTAFTANAGTNLDTSLLSLESTQVALSAKLPSSLGIKTAANSFSVAPASDAIFTQKSSAFRSSAALARAANTTTYGVNDVIFGAFELTNIGNSGGIIALTDIRFLMDITYLPSGIGNLKLYLYGITPPSAVADNGAFSVPSGDRASLLTPSGISLGTPALATGGGSLVLSLAKVNQFLKLTGTSLFGYLVTEGAWVPTANSETATLTVMAVEV